MLQKETKIGLTYGQIIATVSLLLIMFGGFVNIKMDIAVLFQRVNTGEQQLNAHKDENYKEINKLYIENREDHGRIMVKLDNLTESVLKNRP